MTETTGVGWIGVGWGVTTLPWPTCNVGGWVGVGWGGGVGGGHHLAATAPWCPRHTTSLPLAWVPTPHLPPTAVGAHPTPLSRCRGPLPLPSPPSPRLSPPAWVLAFRRAATISFPPGLFSPLQLSWTRAPRLAAGDWEEEEETAAAVVGACPGRPGCQAVRLNWTLVQSPRMMPDHTCTHAIPPLSPPTHVRHLHE